MRNDTFPVAGETISVGRRAGAGRPTHVIVIGGGITGLAAAHRVVERAGQDGPRITLTLLEAAEHLGGNIETVHRDGFLIERGPDSFITQKPWALDLCRRIGLADRVISTNPHGRQTMVVHRGRLHPLPEGFLLLAPTRFGPLLASRLFTWRGKLRMALDLLLPRRNRGDESLKSFVVRRLGREAFERAAQPLVAGIYSADPSTLSLEATMPRFLEMERRHRSIIKAILRQRRDAAATQPPEATDTGARYSMFASFDAGMNVLVDALASRLPANAVRLGCAVSGLARDDASGRWTVSITGRAALTADAVIVTTPAYATGNLVRSFDETLAGQLAAIDHVSSVTMALAYRRTDACCPSSCFGFVVPEVERQPLVACTFSSVKFTGRAPDDGVLLRVFLGGATAPHLVDLEDEKLVHTVRRQLRELLGINADPLFTVVHRHRRAMPQYYVNHLDRVAEMMSRVGRWPGLALAGNAFGGVGIPDCIHSGELAADRIMSRWSAVVQEQNE